MFRARCSGYRAFLAPYYAQARTVTTQPNTPLNLDPSLQALLRDVDVSLRKHKARHDAPTARELELWDEESPAQSSPVLEQDFLDVVGDDATRKSPAAYFGSQRIGAVALPFELQNSISRLIAESDKTQLHADAKRLFLNETGGEKGWDASFDVRYKSRYQREEMSERDGTAFASVALPAHFSAILAVFDHLKQRLGPSWRPDQIIDWNAGTGSALWAALHAFQKGDVDHPVMADSTLSSYIAIEKRDGLTTIGKRLLASTEVGDVRTSWQRMFHEEDKISRTEGGDVIALSAFSLSSLQTPLAKKQLVKEMWESGANMIILIDHNTTVGFESIAEAREVLLRMGRKEFEDPETADWPVKGAHVVAPCPHDGECPLYHPGSTLLVCGFSQRIQRPEFVRKTKHSGVGHEDIGYSYVVIRRGARPTFDAQEPKVGRLGQVGLRELQKDLAQLETVPPAELVADAEDVHTRVEDPEADADRLASISELSETIEAEDTAQGVVESLRREAYKWPRLVFPPLKRSGHVIIDACTPGGKIMRMTIPKSQGKQPYYDARKSEWGDLFPHEPKNSPQERYQPTRAKRPGGTTPTRGADIGKRGDAKAAGADNRAKKAKSYEKLNKEILEKRKDERRARVRALRLEQVDEEE